jgi:hypothetical protein
MKLQQISLRLIFISPHNAFEMKLLVKVINETAEKVVYFNFFK